MQCMYVCLLDHICMICWKQTQYQSAERSRNCPPSSKILTSLLLLLCYMGIRSISLFCPSDTNQSISKRQISNHISSFPRQIMVICGSHKFLIKKKCLFLSLTLFHGSLSRAYKIITRNNCYIFIYKYTKIFFFQTNFTIFKAIDCE